MYDVLACSSTHEGCGWNVILSTNEFHFQSSNPGPPSFKALTSSVFCWFKMSATLLQPTDEQAVPPPPEPQLEVPEEREPLGPDQDREASVTMSIVSEAILSDIKPAIQKSEKWRVLVYGISEPDQEEANEHHLSLLGGIIGDQISPDKKTLTNFGFKKNGVAIIIHVGSHEQCTVTYEDVDLLLFFVAAKKGVLDFSKIEAQVREITETKGAMIWKHSVIVLTGVDANAEDFQKKQGNVSTRLETLLNTWRSQISHSLSKAIGDEVGVTSDDVLIQPAGKQEQPDLPTPLEKWFSQLWNGCFLSSKVKSMPAILKLAMRRITNTVRSKDIQKCSFHLQPIEAKIEPLNIKERITEIGRKAPIRASTRGAMVGAVIAGALAFGVTSPDITTPIGIGIAVAGGVLGACVAAAFCRKTQPVSREPEKIRTSELKPFYTELLTLTPSICTYLTNWAKLQDKCKIVVAGIEGEGVSTVAAALTEQEPTKGTKLYKKRIAKTNASIVVHDFPGLPKEGDKQVKARELVDFQKNYSTNLLIFCIPITSSREDFVYSHHLKYLDRLREVDSTILSHTVIALTHINELREEIREQNINLQTTFKQFFVEELQKWIKHIKMILQKYTNSEDSIANLPIIPVGDVEVKVDFSDDENPTPDTQFHWLSELLVHAMPATEPEGLPTLIKTNKRRLEEQPDEYIKVDQTQELIVKAQCTMFSKIGLRDRSHQGEAIGLMLGMNDEQEW